MTVAPDGRPSDMPYRVVLLFDGACYFMQFQAGTSRAGFVACAGGAGIVTEVGADVTAVHPGEHVVLTWNVASRCCRRTP